MSLFAGVRVIELAQYVMVPAAGAMLADLGAEVIKIEQPGTGDPYRSLVVDRRATKGPNFSLEQNNRGKKSVALDLKSEDGRQLLLRLLAGADVFLTSLRPKALARLGLTPEALARHNPRLIYARANGLGFKGDEADKPGFDASSFWSRGGFAHMLSSLVGAFVRQPRALGDHASAMNLAFGVAGALFRRERTGEAPLVETSLLATAAWMLSNDVVAAQDPHYPPDVLQKAVEHNPLVGTYRTRDDRWIQLVFLDADRYWPGFCTVIGRPDLATDPRFATAKLRGENGRTLLALIADTIAQRSWDEWRPAFQAFDAPWELVRTLADVHADPQVHANGYLFDLTTADGYPVRLVASPLTVDGVAGHAGQAAPECGQHTDALLGQAGLAAGEIAALRATGVVG
jgi:crotonobetainyl-CoA:carnitine CoA-transferase CaiB-like acyl-CoA transferase